MLTQPRVQTIGALASAAGVATSMIRYYEDIGLLPRPRRSASGQRVYEPSDLERLTFIRRCRDFGFSVDQVRLLSGLAISTTDNCAEVRDIAASHLAEIRAKVAELLALEQSVAGFVAQCDAVCAGGPGRDCQVFRSLTVPAPASHPAQP